MHINSKVNSPAGFGTIVGSNWTKGKEKKWQVRLANGDTKWYVESQLSKF